MVAVHRRPLFLGRRIRLALDARNQDPHPRGPFLAPVGLSAAWLHQAGVSAAGGNSAPGQPRPQNKEFWAGRPVAGTKWKLILLLETTLLGSCVSGPVSGLLSSHKVRQIPCAGWTKFPRRASSVLRPPTNCHRVNRRRVSGRDVNRGLAPAFEPPPGSTRPETPPSWCQREPARFRGGCPRKARK